MERHLEMGPQELGLQDSPCRPLEPPSQTVKEESDMEQELGEKQFSYSWWCVMLSWGVLGIVVSGPQSELKMRGCSDEGISGKFGTGWIH